MSASDNARKNQIVPVVALALRHRPSGEFMLARRGPLESGAGEWEFPGGKIEPGETPQAALRREIQEELQFDIGGRPITLLGQHHHTYPSKTIDLSLWLVEVDVKPDFVLIDHDETKWLRPDLIQESELTDGDKFFISLIKSV